MQGSYDVERERAGAWVLLAAGIERAAAAIKYAKGKAALKWHLRVMRNKVLIAEWADGQRIDSGHIGRGRGQQAARSWSPAPASRRCATPGCPKHKQRGPWCRACAVQNGTWGKT
jgi:hypothetical protein